MLASARRAAIASRSLRRWPSDGDAKLLEVLRRQVRQDRLVYLILAEDRLILPEAQAPQPDHNVHRGAPTFSGEADHPLGGREESRAGVGLSEDRKIAEVKQGEGSAREHWKAEGAG